MGVLCIQRTINRGLWAGTVSGLGIALGDTIYAIIAGFGLSFIAEFLDEYHVIIRMLGFVFLLYIGYKIFFAHPARQFRDKGRPRRSSPLTDILSTFVLTITNPLTIIAFGGVFGGLGLVDSTTGNLAVAALITGIFFGALLWWFSLSSVINRFRDRIRLRNIWWINKITGSLIFFLGVGGLIAMFWLHLL